MKKDDYEVRMGDGSLVPVSAWMFPVHGTHGLIVHRDVEYDKQWTVSEPRSGAFICRLRATRKGAIEDATNLVGENVGKFRQFMSGYLDKYKDSKTKFEEEIYEECSDDAA